MMEKENQIKNKIVHVSISQKYSEKLESLLATIKTHEPLAKVNKQKLVELAIENLTENDVLSFSQKHKDKRAMVLEYLKQNRSLSDPESLIELLKK